MHCLFPFWTAFLIDLRKPFFNPSCIIPHLNCNKCFCPVCSCCCCYVASVMSDSVRPQKQQPPRLPDPWDSPGKNTGVGCHFLLQCMKVKVKLLSRVRLFATPWTATHQAPPSMGFSRQEYWSGVPLPSPQFVASLCLMLCFKLTYSTNGFLFLCSGL